MNKEGYVNDQAEIKLLLREARAKNEEAFSRLLAIYEPLIFSMTVKYVAQSGQDGDKDDVRQELLVAFYNAVMKYDLEQNDVGFGLYAKVCLKNALASHIRKRIGARFEILPIDEMTELYSPDDPEKDVFEAESARFVQKLIDENLSTYEKRVWGLHLEGKKPAEIAEILEKDPKSISNALSRIRAKLRALVGDIYHI